MLPVVDTHLPLRQHRCLTALLLLLAACDSDNPSEGWLLSGGNLHVMGTEPHTVQLANKNCEDKLEVKLARHEKVYVDGVELGEYNHTVVVQTDKNETLPISFVDESKVATELVARAISVHYAIDANERPRSAKTQPCSPGSDCSVEVARVAAADATPFAYVAFHGFSKREVDGASWDHHGDPLIIIVPKNDSVCPS